MAWYVAAFLAACFESSKDFVQKKSLTDCNPHLFAWGSVTFSILPLVVILTVMGLPNVGNTFWPALFLVCLLDALGLSLHIRAMQKSDLSIVAPLLMFTPLFLLVTSPIMIGEYPDFLGIVGVLLVIIGSYLLNVETLHLGLLTPFKALLSDSGARCMFGAAFIFSITCNLHKFCIVQSSTYYYATLHQIGCALFLSIPVFINRKDLQINKASVKASMTVGVIIFLILMSQFYAFSHGMVVYTTAIKRLSVLISICLAFLFLKERGFKERLTGAGIMTGGAIMTAF